MGFTHYIDRPEKLDKDKFIQAVADCARVCKAIRAPICGEYDDPDSPAIFSPSLIWFNGIGDDGHETFVIEQTYPVDKADYVQWHGEKIFQFCKTARKPYDTAVVACLVILHHYFGDDIIIRSDGRPKEWEEGLQAVKDYLGYGEIPKTISEK